MRCPAADRDDVSKGSRRGFSRYQRPPARRVASPGIRSEANPARRPTREHSLGSRRGGWASRAAPPRGRPLARRRGLRAPAPPPPRRPRLAGRHTSRTSAHVGRFRLVCIPLPARAPCCSPIVGRDAHRTTQARRDVGAPPSGPAQPRRGGTAPWVASGRRRAFRSSRQTASGNGAPAARARVSRRGTGPPRLHRTNARTPRHITSPRSAADRHPRRSGTVKHQVRTRHRLSRS